VDPRIEELVEGIATRAAAEPDLEDFLCWTAGTLEYWLHIIASSVGRRLGWASTTEVPYITGCPAATAKTDTKWADGAIVLPGGVGVLLEVKTVPARGSVPGPTVKKVPADFAALLSADWSRTLAQAPDKYAGQQWVEQRSRMSSVTGLQLLLVHGEINAHEIDAAVHTGVEAGVATLAYRYRHSTEPTLLSPLREAMLNGPATRLAIANERAAAYLFAWAAPLASA
jgi:hypothetical protein